MKTTGQRRLALGAVLLAVATVRVGFGAIGPVLPLYVQEHGLDTFMIAVMTNAFMLAQALLQTPAGYLGDRWGRRPVMMLGTWLYTLAAGLFLVDGGPGWFIALRALEGIGASAFGPTVRAYVADMVTDDERGAAFGQLTAFDMAGLLLGPLVGGVAQQFWGPRAPFAVCAVLGLVAAGVLWAFARVPAGVSAAPRGKAGAARVAGAGQQVSSWRMLRAAAFWVVALPSLGFAYFNGLYSVVWSLYMQQNGASAWQVGLSWTIFAIPMVLFTTAAGKLADRVGRPVLIAVGGALSTVTTLAYAFFPAPVPLLVLSGVDGLASSLFMPASSAYMADVAPRGMRGQFFGLAGSVSTAATVFFVMLVGYMYEHYPPGWLFYLGGVVLAVTCGTAVWLMVRHPVAKLRAALERL